MAVRPGRAAWAILGLAVGLLAAACGKRGDPLPPIRHVPQPVTAFRVAQRGAELEISYVVPRNATDGSRLPILEIEVLRAPQAGDFQKVARGAVRKAAPGERLVESEPLPPKGTVLRVAVRARLGGRMSAMTPIATVTVGEPPPAPSELTAQSVTKGVGLQWTAPVMPVVAPSPEASPSPSPTPAGPEGPLASPTPPPSTEPAPSPTPSAEAPSPEAPAGEPSPTPSASPAPEAPAAFPSPSPSPSPSPAAPSFFVYRRSEHGSYGDPLNAVPVISSAFNDESAAPGDSWCYVVRTVASTSPLVESEPSNEACLTVKDVAPPETPVGVTARETGDGIEIAWSPSTDPDRKVYRLYRAAGDGRPVRVAEIEAEATRYLDTSAPKGVLLHYTLTAVDAAGNESSRSSPPAAALNP